MWDDGKEVWDDGKEVWDDGKEVWDDINPIKAWATASIAGSLATLTTSKIIDNIDKVKIAESLDSKKIKSAIESSISMADEYKKLMPNGLTKKQIDTVDNYIENLRNWLTACSDDSLEALNLWNSIGKKMWWIEKEIFKANWLSEKILGKIENLSDEIVGKTPEEIKIILKTNGIDDINESVLKVLSKAENAKEVKDMAKVFRHWSKFNRIAQTIVGAMWVDVAFLWLDVWMYYETGREAELISKVNEIRWKNKQQQANFQLWVWISSVLIEAAALIAIYAATWSAWWPLWVAAGLVVWALTTVVSMWWDYLYYDVRDFYLQNKEDFLRQKRWWLKQAILQCINNKKEWDISLNEKMVTFRDSTMAPWSEKKECTLQDACFSMMFLEEIDEDWICPYDYLMVQYIRSWQKIEDFLWNSNLSDDDKEKFNETYKIISDKISKRMEYVENQFEKEDVINALKWWFWMRYLTKIFNESKIYEVLEKNGHWDSSATFDENKNNYKNDLFKDIPTEKLEKLEKIKEENPSLFLEIIWSTTLDWFLWRKNDEDVIDGEGYENEVNLYYDKYWDKNYEENVKMIILYKKWLSISGSVEDKNHFDVPNIYKNNCYIWNLLKNDFNLNSLDLQWFSFSKNEIIRRVNVWMIREDSLDISDDILQNIMFKLWKQLYWYDWKNDKLEIIQFFNEWSDSTQWIYYDSKRKINKDRAIDDSLLTTVFNFESLDEKDVDKYVDEFMSNFFTETKTVNRETWEETIKRTPKALIDTATEAIDTNLIMEFLDTLREIVKEELMDHTVENQKRVKEDIHNFIIKYWNWENYIDLPYYLILDAKKAWLWDISRQYFRYDGDKIEICSMPSELNQRSVIDDCEKSYITPARESFTEEELYYINRVDTACIKLDCIIDDLWLPSDLNDIIVNKKNEWKIFKQNILLYNWLKAMNSETIKKYEEFAEYFENLYRWILIAVSWFTFWNDIKNIDYFNMAMAYWNQNLFDESWNLLEVNDENSNTRNELVKQNYFKNFYNKQIETLKVWEKTVKELRNSEDKKEKELWYFASTLIYTTVLESALIKSDWKIAHPWYSSYQSQTVYIGESTVTESISYNESRFTTLWEWIDNDKINKLEKLLEDKIKDLKIPPEISDEKVNKLRKEQDIQKITQEEKVLSDITPTIQSKIEKTWEQFYWKWKRGNILYDPEKKVIKSRWKEVEVEILSENNIKLVWLDLSLTLDEIVWLANFKNWLKYTYWNKEVEHTRWIKSRFWTYYVGTTQIIERETLEKYCHCCNDHNTREKIKDRLNK